MLKADSTQPIRVMHLATVTEAERRELATKIGLELLRDYIDNFVTAKDDWHKVWAKEAVTLADELLEELSK